MPTEARAISVSLDRVSVPMEEPRARPVGRPKQGAPKRPVTRAFRMAYCGTVTLHDEHGEALHTLRYGRMPAGDAEGLVEGMGADVRELLNKASALRVVLLCDGAPEMWNLLDAVFTGQFLGQKPVRHLDVHHFVEKMAAAAKVIHGEASRPVVERWKLRLLNQPQAAGTIRRELDASGLEDVRVGDARPVHDALTYIDNHADRLDFATPRALGLPIGSGNVEATCKSLFEVRLKRSGCRWKEETGDHVVRLRAAALSDRWEPTITKSLEPLRKAIRAA